MGIMIKSRKTMGKQLLKYAIASIAVFALSWCGGVRGTDDDYAASQNFWPIAAEQRNEISLYRHE